MKKVVILLAATFVLAMAVSSCNKKACPAYSKANTEQYKHVG
jgi:hypothetical protein